MNNKLRLHGFNNLTKTLSFNIYDVCYTKTEKERLEYIEYIDELYSADRLTKILTEVVDIIGAHILIRIVRSSPGLLSERGEIRCSLLHERVSTFSGLGGLIEEIGGSMGHMLETINPIRVGVKGPFQQS